MKFLLLAIMFYSQQVYAVKIVSTSPAITEMIKLLDEEKSLVAVSDYCKSELPKVGSSLDLNIEKVALLKPDWVLVQKSSSVKVIENLKKAQIPYLELELIRLADIERAFLKIATLLKKIEYAEQVFQSERANVTKSKMAQRVVIVLGDDGRGAQWSVASNNTLYADIIEVLGHKNAFPGESGKYLLIGPEEILKLDADAFVFLTNAIETGLFKHKKAKLIYIGNELAQIPSPKIYTFIQELGERLK